ncbi:MAG: nucleoside phosphorylase [Bacteroidia bacterium]|nr:nucleoside phosphorylase [Bacteroidia bacterium]
MRTPSELIRRADGSIYHLALQPGDLADAVLLAGDPERVDQIAARLDSVELERSHREFRTVTGHHAGRRLTVLSTGIGTDNIDIVLQELDALANLDLDTGLERPVLRRLRLLRLGTCGAVRPEAAPGTLIASRFAIGGDAMPAYYRLPVPAGLPAELMPQLQALESAGWPPLYAAAASGSLHALLNARFPDILQGITFTAAGFYGPQGRRAGRLPLRFPDLTAQLAPIRAGGLAALNIEMETSALLALAGAMGHAAGSICAVLANRATGAFAEDPQACVDNLIVRGLEVMQAWIGTEQDPA